jgi:serine protease Do
MSTNNAMKEVNDASALLIEKVRPTLVQVTSGRRGAGAGIVWSSDGLIITNAHVIRRSKPQVIFSDGKTLPAEVLGLDRENDLAALRVEAKDLPAVEAGNSRELGSGQMVMALGHPWGIIGAVTSGMVVSSGRNLAGMPGGERELIAVSLHLRPGFSGGPLIDDQGRVVGVNVMMAGPEVGLAIPSHIVEEFLKALAEATEDEAPQPQWAPSPAIDV